MQTTQGERKGEVSFQGLNPAERAGPGLLKSSARRPRRPQHGSAPRPAMSYKTLRRADMFYCGARATLNFYDGGAGLKRSLRGGRGRGVWPFLGHPNLIYLAEWP